MESEGNYVVATGERGEDKCGKFASLTRLLVEEQEIDEIGMDESISRHVSIVCDKTRNSDSFDG